MTRFLRGGGRRSPPLLFVCVCLLLPVLGRPALAGWAYTEWGMSEREVMAAANGAVGRFYEPNPEPWGLYPDLIGDHRDLQHSFEVEFYFERGGLVGVRLAPYGRYWCMDLLQALRLKFGPERMTWRGGIIEFVDERANNLISHRFVPCTVRYQPLRRQPSPAPATAGR